jgi:signal transduction histidine kinase
MRSVDELWLETLQQINARASHEIKGALNGVSVNLEVVRSRAAKADAAAVAVAPFANSAADQLEEVISMADALLLLGRAPRDPIEVGATIRQLVAILGPAARSEGGSLRVEEVSPGAPGKGVRANGNMVRLTIGAAMLAALRRAGETRCRQVRCRVEVGEETVVVVECVDDSKTEKLQIEPEIVAAATEGGVRVQLEEQAISLAFARAGAARQRTHERA